MASSKVKEMFNVCRSSQKLFHLSHAIRCRKEFTMPSRDGGDDDSFEVALKIAQILTMRVLNTLLEGP